MPDLLSADLDDAGDVRTVDPKALLNLVRRGEMNVADAAGAGGLAGDSVPDDSCSAT